MLGCSGSEGNLLKSNQIELRMVDSSKREAILFTLPQDTLLIVLQCISLMDIARLTIAAVRNDSLTKAIKALRYSWECEYTDICGSIPSRCQYSYSAWRLFLQPVILTAFDCQNDDLRNMLWNVRYLTFYGHNLTAIRIEDENAFSFLPSASLIPNVRSLELTCHKCDLTMFEYLSLTNLIVSSNYSTKLSAHVVMQTWPLLEGIHLANGVIDIEQLQRLDGSRVTSFTVPVGGSLRCLNCFPNLKKLVYRPKSDYYSSRNEVPDTVELPENSILHNLTHLNTPFRPTLLSHCLNLTVLYVREVSSSAMMETIATHCCRLQFLTIECRIAETDPILQAAEEKRVLASIGRGLTALRTLEMDYCPRNIRCECDHLYHLLRHGPQQLTSVKLTGHENGNYWPGKEKMPHEDFTPAEGEEPVRDCPRLRAVEIHRYYPSSTAIVLRKCPKLTFVSVATEVTDVRGLYEACPAMKEFRYYGESDNIFHCSHDRLERLDCRCIFSIKPWEGKSMFPSLHTLSFNRLSDVSSMVALLESCHLFMERVELRGASIQEVVDILKGTITLPWLHFLRTLIYRASWKYVNNTFQIGHITIAPAGRP